MYVENSGAELCFGDLSRWRRGLCESTERAGIFHAYLHELRHRLLRLPCLKSLAPCWLRVSRRKYFASTSWTRSPALGRRDPVVRWVSPCPSTGLRAAPRGRQYSRMGCHRRGDTF